MVFFLYATQIIRDVSDRANLFYVGKEIQHGSYGGHGILIVLAFYGMVRRCTADACRVEKKPTRQHGRQGLKGLYIPGRKREAGRQKRGWGLVASSRFK